VEVHLISTSPKQTTHARGYLLQKATLGFEGGVLCHEDGEDNPGGVRVLDPDHVNFKRVQKIRFQYSTIHEIQQLKMS
jgi:hypothetical protein